MADEYGSDFITIVDEDGTEFELEVLSSIEYNGETYLAVTLADNEDADLEVSILKSVEEEDGEPILCAEDYEIELETVYNLIMDQIYEEEEEYSTPAWCVACPFGPTFFIWDVRLPYLFADLPPTL